MRILVTGSKGFIGSYLVPELLKQGHEIVHFDRSEGKDLLNQEQIKEAFEGKIEAVIHLAALLDETLPYKTLFQTNVIGTRNLLEEAAKKGVKKFIFLSTVGVMGDIKEKANEQTPFKPVTNYEKSKAEAEKLVLEFQELLPVVILRSALVYGPNKYWTSIIKLVKKGFPIIGSGKNFMQLIYVKDFVSAILFLLEKEDFNETYLIAEEKASTLNEVYAAIAQALGKKVKVKHLPLALGLILAHFNSFLAKLTGKKTILLPSHVKRLVRLRLYDTSKIKALGWRAKYSLRKGMQETIWELRAQKKI